MVKDCVCVETTLSTKESIVERERNEDGNFLYIEIH